MYLYLIFVSVQIDISHSPGPRQNKSVGSCGALPEKQTKKVIKLQRGSKNVEKLSIDLIITF